MLSCVSNRNEAVMVWSKGVVWMIEGGIEASPVSFGRERSVHSPVTVVFRTESPLDAFCRWYVISSDASEGSTARRCRARRVKRSR